MSSHARRDRLSRSLTANRSLPRSRNQPQSRSRVPSRSLPGSRSLAQHRSLSQPASQSRVTTTGTTITGTITTDTRTNPQPSRSPSRSRSRSRQRSRSPPVSRSRPPASQRRNVSLFFQAETIMLCCVLHRDGSTVLCCIMRYVRISDRGVLLGDIEIHIPEHLSTQIFVAHISLSLRYTSHEVFLRLERLWVDVEHVMLACLLFLSHFLRWSRK